MNDALRTEEKGSFCVSFFKSINDGLPKYRGSILSVVVSIKKNRKSYCQIYGPSSYKYKVTRSVSRKSPEEEWAHVQKSTQQCWVPYTM